jgi:hypothetical protein
VRGVTPVRGIRMRERAYTFSAILGRTRRIVLTIVYTVTQPIENCNMKLRMIRSMKF